MELRKHLINKYKSTFALRFLGEFSVYLLEEKKASQVIVLKAINSFLALRKIKVAAHADFYDLESGEYEIDSKDFVFIIKKIIYFSKKKLSIEKKSNLLEESSVFLVSYLRKGLSLNIILKVLDLSQSELGILLSRIKAKSDIYDEALFNKNYHELSWSNQDVLGFKKYSLNKYEKFKRLNFNSWSNYFSNTISKTLFDLESYQKNHKYFCSQIESF